MRHSKALVFVFDVKPEGPPGGEELLAHVALVPVAPLHVVLDLGLARELRRAGLAADDRRLPGVASVACFFRKRGQEIGPSDICSNACFSFFPTKLV